MWTLLIDILCMFMYWCCVLLSDFCHLVIKWYCCYDSCNYGSLQLHHSSMTSLAMFVLPFFRHFAAVVSCMCCQIRFIPDWIGTYICGLPRPLVESLNDASSLSAPHEQFLRHAHCHDSYSHLHTPTLMTAPSPRLDVMQHLEHGRCYLCLEF